MLRSVWDLRRHRHRNFRVGLVARRLGWEFTCGDCGRRWRMYVSAIGSSSFADMDRWVAQLNGCMAPEGEREER